MKVLLDTNVILDVLLNRPAFSANSKKIFDFVEQKRITGYISVTSVTDIFYITIKEFKNRGVVYQAIDELAVLFTIVPVVEATITSALALRWNDFEDAVQYMAAKENGIDCVITRNTIDYKTSDITCMSPVEFIAFIEKGKTKE